MDCAFTFAFTAVRWLPPSLYTFPLRALARRSGLRADRVPGRLPCLLPVASSGPVAISAAGGFSGGALADHASALVLPIAPT